jgi:hypothetical protein
LLAKPAPYFTLALFDAERQNNALKTFRILMAVEFASREISEKYDRFARCYDWLEGIQICWESEGCAAAYCRVLQEAS